jgi:hypothetical protein
MLSRVHSFKKMRIFVLVAKQFVKQNISQTLKSNQKTNEKDSMKTLRAPQLQADERSDARAVPAAQKISNSKS